MAKHDDPELDFEKITFRELIWSRLPLKFIATAVSSLIGIGFAIGFWAPKFFPHQTSDLTNPPVVKSIEENNVKAQAKVEYLEKKLRSAEKRISEIEELREQCSNEIARLLKESNIDKYDTNLQVENRDLKDKISLLNQKIFEYDNINNKLNNAF